jgi:hypothetical protein
MAAKAEREIDSCKFQEGRLEKKPSRSVNMNVAKSYAERCQVAAAITGMSVEVFGKGDPRLKPLAESALPQDHAWVIIEGADPEAFTKFWEEMKRLEAEAKKLGPKG